MKIIFPPDLNVSITQELKNTPYKKLKLAYADVVKADTDFGTVILQHYQSADFAIGYQLLFSDKPSTVSIRFEKPLLMLSFLLDGAVSYLKDADLNESSVMPGTYHLCYENQAEHPLHLSKGYLENFFIILSESYLEKMENPPEQVKALIAAVVTASDEPLHSPFYKISARIRKNIREMIAYTGNHTSLFLQSKVNELLLLYLGSVSRMDFPEPVFSGEQKRLKAITEFIGQVLDMPITVQGLAKRFNFSVTYLHKKFKTAYGITPYKYIQEQRMLKAKRLLTESNLFKTEYIASLCGYDDVSNFYAAFKKRFGHTPSYYRMAGRTLR
jgi:AraC-like DNA-binding protein